MAWFAVARVLFVAAVGGLAALVQPLPFGLSANLAFGLLFAAAFVAGERRLRGVDPVRIAGAALGVVVGLLVVRVIESTLTPFDASFHSITFVRGFALIALPSLGLGLGSREGEWLRPSRLRGVFFHAPASEQRFRILDTSVIIDGRVADVCGTGFLDGTLVVPQFVLKELQLVADSSDALKRNRGRRGLDILQKIQKMAGVDVTISDLDYPEIRDVDLKLIELARALPGKIVTNDFNLNKVAQLRGVGVLNVNDLANAVKPVVLPGELMTVLVLKEGKEASQGVAYLDDGTMVVVDNARKMMGRTIDIVVTSVLQTTAGKMIFGRYIDPASAMPAAVDRDGHGSPRPAARPQAAPPPAPPGQG